MEHLEVDVVAIKLVVLPYVTFYQPSPPNYPLSPPSYPSQPPPPISSQPITGDITHGLFNDAKKGIINL